jgi:hypothetical protein
MIARNATGQAHSPERNLLMAWRVSAQQTRLTGVIDERSEESGGAAPLNQDFGARSEAEGPEVASGVPLFPEERSGGGKSGASRAGF